MFSSDAARYVPTIPTKDGKNIKSAVIRIICVIRVPSKNSELRKLCGHLRLSNVHLLFS